MALAWRVEKVHSFFNSLCPVPKEDISAPFHLKAEITSVQIRILYVFIEMGFLRIPLQGGGDSTVITLGICMWEDPGLIPLTARTKQRPGRQIDR